MSKSVSPIKTTAQRVDDLVNDARKDITNESTEKLKARVKSLLIERTKAAKVLANLDREIDELKLEIAQELESL